MSVNGTKTMYNEMDDMWKETLDRTMCLSGRITGSHDITQDSLYVYKGKAIPLQAWSGPEGSRSLRLPDFKTIGT